MDEVIYQRARNRRYKRWHKLILSACQLVSVSLLLLPTSTLACGLPFNVRLPSEQALISYANGQQEIVTSVQLTDAGANAAVIFPVPSVPQVSAVQSDELFSYLADITKPLIVEDERLVWRQRDMAAGGAAPDGVSVLGRAVVGGYDVARLAADDSNALQTWLAQNDYVLPAAAAPILKVYADAGWKFVAVKLAANQPSDGALRPLRMTFASREIVYPMRLGALSDKPVDVLLYVLSDQRINIPGLETQYAGPVASLDRAPAADLAPLFRAPYLTKLRSASIDPASLSADFVARPAATSAPYRETQTRIVYVNGWDRMQRPILALVCVAAMSALGLGIAFGLLAHFKRIAPPKSDSDDTMPR